MLDDIPAFIKRRIGKIGSIGEYFAEQCETPWTAIIKVLPGAAAKPALSLITFGIDDVLRGYFRPRGLKGPRKLRSRQRWYNRPTIPEIGEEIGKRLPYAEEVKGRAFGSLQKWAWIADGAIQRVLYYTLVFDVVLDTWYNSIVALHRQGFCKTAGAPRALQGALTHWYNFNPPMWLAQPPAPPQYTYAGNLQPVEIFAIFSAYNPGFTQITTRVSVGYYDTDPWPKFLIREIFLPPYSSATVVISERLDAIKVHDQLLLEVIAAPPPWDWINRPTAYTYLSAIPTTPQ